MKKEKEIKINVLSLCKPIVQMKLQKKNKERKVNMCK